MKELFTYLWTSRISTLGKDRNAEMQVDMHPSACKAAWAAESARKQGKFWPFHDAIFAYVLKSGEETLTQIVRDAGLDMKRLVTDRHDQKHCPIGRDVAMACQ